MRLANKLMLGVLLVLVGCASTNDVVNKQLDAKLAQEKAPKGPEQLGKEARAGIVKSKGLSAEQKEKLLSIQRSAESKAKDLRETSLKLRELLIKDLSARTYDEKEVAVIKDRLKGVEDLRLSLIFETVDKVNEVVGRESADKEEVLRSFDFDDSHVRF